MAYTCTSKLRVDYHPFSTVTWCLLQKGYHTQLHILITCHLYAQCGRYVLIHPAMIYVSHKYDDK
jgi:hypothetical protein